MVCEHLVQTPGKTAGCIIWTGENERWIKRCELKYGLECESLFREYNGGVQ